MATTDVATKFARMAELSAKISGKTATTAELNEFAALRREALGEARQHDSTLKEAGIKLVNKSDAEPFAVTINRFAYQYYEVLAWRDACLRTHVTRYNRIAHDNNLPKLDTGDGSVDAIRKAAAQLAEMIAKKTIPGEWGDVARTELAKGRARGVKQYSKKAD